MPCSRLALLAIPFSVAVLLAPLHTAGQDLSIQLSQQGLDPRPLEFHQYRGVQFELNGTPAKLVEPKQWAAGRPWIWRARFWGHQPALDLALLERGYGLAYCDVANLYGSPQAVARWDAFYELTQTLSMNARPILEGMSRGGLIVFNWAKKNPTRVAAIYGDNPVCDIRSWPAMHSPADWQRCLAAYGISEPEASQFAGNPIDNLLPLVEAQVPVFLVLGEDDQVVPIEDNGLELARRYEAVGGTVRKWIKPDQGHHPHGLDPVSPLLNQLLVASPRPELAQLPLELLTDRERILVLGDSITYSGETISHLATWANRAHGVPSDRFLNLGLPSETVSGLSEEGHAGGRFPRPNLHERLERVLDETKPDLMIACYGINCGIYLPFDAQRLATYQQGLMQLKQAADARGIEVLFVTPPVFDAQQRPDAVDYEGVMHSYAHWLIGQQQLGWHVIDVHFPMQAALSKHRGQQPDFTLQPDGVHPNSQGHRVMATALISAFARGTNTPAFDDPEYAKQFAQTHQGLKARQRELLESTGHLRPGVPGYKPK